MVWPGRAASRLGSVSNRSRATSRSSILGFVSANVTGSPAGVQAPEVAGVAGAVSVASPSGQLGALGGGTGSAALDGGGIDHPGVVAPQVGVGGQQADEVNELLGGASQPLVVAGLAGQVGKQVAQVGAGVG